MKKSKSREAGDESPAEWGERVSPKSAAAEPRVLRRGPSLARRKSSGKRSSDAEKEAAGTDRTGSDDHRTDPEKNDDHPPLILDTPSLNKVMNARSSSTSNSDSVPILSSDKSRVESTSSAQVEASYRCHYLPTSDELAEQPRSSGLYQNPFVRTWSSLGDASIEYPSSGEDSRHSSGGGASSASSGASSAASASSASSASSADLSSDLSSSLPLAGASSSSIDGLQKAKAKAKAKSGPKAKSSGVSRVGSGTVSAAKKKSVKKSSQSAAAVPALRTSKSEKAAPGRVSEGGTGSGSGGTGSGSINATVKNPGQQIRDRVAAFEVQSAPVARRTTDHLARVFFKWLFWITFVVDNFFSKYPAIFLFH